MRLKRYGLLVAGVVTFVVMGVFAVVPIAWISAGRPDESYPELLYAGLGLPAALIAIVGGALFAKFSSSRSKGTLVPLQTTTWCAILVCAWLLVAGLGPNSPAFDAFVGPSLDALFSFGLPALVVALIVSVRTVTRPSTAAPAAPKT